MISVIQRARGALATYQLLRVPEWIPPQPWWCSRKLGAGSAVEETWLQFLHLATPCSNGLHLYPAASLASLSHLHNWTAAKEIVSVIIETTFRRPATHPITGVSSAPNKEQASLHPHQKTKGTVV